MNNLRVAVLVDLPRESASGGHVKYWERIARAASSHHLPLDLTIYFSGQQDDIALSSQVRYRFLPPVFSTARLKFLPYVPAHTDLAPFHPALAQELPEYDVIHTTEAYFAFARTAERIARWNKIPLVTSFHTDTPAYAELYTRQTLQHVLGTSFGNFVARFSKMPERQRTQKEKRLVRHLQTCAAIMTMREEDIAFAQQVTSPRKIKPMRLGVDKNLFVPDQADRAGVERDYDIAPGKFLILFVGRVDEGKNISVLVKACAQAIAKGANLHLIVAGLGPMSDRVKETLGTNATLAGWVEADGLARLYASVDCLAIASDIEIGGMIGLEALASGCPVVVSRSSGVAQLCGSPPAMHMVESGVDSWAQALQELAQDKNRQKDMRAAVLDFRTRNLAGWDEVLEQDFMKIWQDVAGKET